MPSGSYKRTKEHALALSKALIGRKLTEEHKAKLKITRQKQVIRHSPETKEKIRLSN